jgi:anti-sigma B factor antagonist
MFTIQQVGEGQVRLRGRLDAAEAEGALDELRRLSGPLTVDCSDLDYISSAGLGVIMATFKRLTDTGSTLLLANMQPRVRNVFKYSGLDKVLEIRPSE